MKYNRNNPPPYGKLTAEQFLKQVDMDSFPVCSSCSSPIYNPAFYNKDMCGPCTTGESKTIMRGGDSYKGRGMILAGIKIN